MTAQLFLNPQVATPMYRQIIDQVTTKVMAGDWAAGQLLPSIRELAASSQVSVITVKRAYLELERAGLIVTRAGRGSFVAESQDLPKALLRAEWQAQFDALIQRAAQLGISREELRRLLDGDIAPPSDPAP